MALEVERPRRFTAEEFERMVEAAVFPEDERLELIEGEIIQMAPIGHRHAACLANLNEQFVRGLSGRALVWVTGPARLAIDSVPEPDLALLRRRSYRSGSPRPDDVHLIVEVAESSLRYDRTRKLRLYARAEILEYWIVGVDGEWIEVCRSPEADGFRERSRAVRGETIAPLAFADVRISVDDVFA
ncbi:MAG TPA: Uma2 family endonuclease [Methylomirabilota bacterium]|nr:Uma2 family endonuclease [Methylomirabilota bacterium]